MIDFILSPHLVEALGWTLLHSLWQGAVFAILLALVLITLRSYTAQSRYVVIVGVLCSFFITVAATFYQQWNVANLPQELSSHLLDPHQSGKVAFLNELAPNQFQSASQNQNGLPVQSEVLTNQPHPWLVTLRDYYSRHLPLLVTIWLLGVLFLQLRFLGQLAYVQRLKHYGTQMFPLSWSDKIEQLEDKLRIQKKVSYLTSLRVESPMVIGWLRPVVLLPKTLFTSLSETEIYAVLAHELAHIRREDFLVNLLQTFLCNVFFFHPGVWWMSHRVDDEREHCCDDLAVAATGPATSYAKTLINVSEHQLNVRSNADLAIALSGKRKKRERGGFTGRIHRLFLVKNGVGTFREGFATACILVTALFLGLAATGSTVASEIPSSSTIDQSEAHSQNENPISNQVQPNDAKTKTVATTEVKSDVNNIQIDKPKALPTVALPVPVPPVQPDEIPQEPNGGVTVIVKTTTQHDQNIGADFFQDHLRKKNRPLIHELTLAGLIEKVQEMVEEGVDVNSIDDYGRTPLHIASAENHNIDMRVLIDLGADINAQDQQGRTPLMYAAADGGGEAVTLLVAEGADVYLQDVDGMRAYEWGQASGKPDLAKIIKVVTDNVNQEAFLQKQRKKHLQKQKKKREEVHIAADGFHLRQYDMEKKIPALLEAARNGSVTDCAQLLHQGLSVNVTDDTGQTALMAAVMANRMDVAKFLIAQGADIDKSSASGLTALHYAALENYGQMARLLIKHQAEVDPTMRYSSTDGNYTNQPLVWEYLGATPLLIAVEAGNTDVVAVLIEAGANIHHTLKRNEYRLNKNRKNYLTGGEVMGLDKEFLKEVEFQTSDSTWSPYKHALLINKPEMLTLFSN